MPQISAVMTQIRIRRKRSAIDTPPRLEGFIFQRRLEMLVPARPVQNLHTVNTALN